MSKKYSIILFFCVTIFFTACQDKKNNGATDTINKNTESTFNLKTVDGKIIKVVHTNDKWRFKGYENQVILLNFFATWCLPCKAEIPYLINLQNKYKDKMIIISILLEDGQSNSNVKNFIKKHGINYIVTNSKENYKLSDKLGGIHSIPTMFIFNTNGKIIEKYKGAVHQEMIDIDIQKGLIN
jgi:thiol-disulfide isomerase/thioredoxin